MKTSIIIVVLSPRTPLCGSRFVFGSINYEVNIKSVQHLSLNPPDSSKPDNSVLHVATDGILITSNASARPLSAYVAPLRKLFDVSTTNHRTLSLHLSHSSFHNSSADSHLNPISVLL
jgi:hypothetical protein